MNLLFYVFHMPLSSTVLRGHHGKDVSPVMTKAFQLSGDKSTVILRKACKLLLAFCYCFGLLSGALLASGTGSDVLSTMRTAPFARVSIMSLITVTSLPFLIAAIAVYLSRLRLLYFICTAKAFLFGYCMMCVSIGFGSAGWLVRGLLLFTEILLQPLLILFCIRHLEGEKRHLWGEFGCCLCLVFLLGSIDHCLVSPYLVMLIH